MNKFSFFCNNALKIGTSKFVKLGKKVACVSFHFSVCFFYLYLRLEPSSVLCFAFFCSGSIKAQSSVLSRAYSLLGGLFFVFYNIYIFIQYFVKNSLQISQNLQLNVQQKLFKKFFIIIIIIDSLMNAFFFSYFFFFVFCLSHDHQYDNGMYACV